MWIVIVYRNDGVADPCEKLLDRVVGPFANDEACHRWAETNVGDAEFSISEVEFVGAGR